MNTPIFRKSLSLLLHPLSLVAIGLLFVNDILLNKLWPSWWTGKIGDFAWLFFVPFVLAVVLAFILPKRLKQEKWVGVLAFVLTGSFFALIKTVPEFRDFVVQLFHELVGIRIWTMVDPTDLIALVALLFSGWLWNQQRNYPITTPIPRRNWFILPLVGLVLLADMAEPNRGIDCFFLRDQQIWATSVNGSYRTLDGGLSWQTDSSSSDWQNCTYNNPKQQVTDPLNRDIIYRFNAGAKIERSADQGKSWLLDSSLTLNSQAQQVYASGRHGQDPLGISGPLDVIGDPVTGNVLFAMGHDGVLVRKADASWAWSAVGHYDHKELFREGWVFNLLRGEAWLAFDLVLLLLGTWTVRLVKTKRKLWIFALGISWLCWGIVTILFPHALTSSYVLPIPSGLLIVTTLLSLPIAIVSAIWLARDASLLLYGLFAAITGFLFFLSYYLWGINLLHDYTMARLFALLSTGVCGIIGFFPRARTNE